MPLALNEIRTRAQCFASDWADAASERAEAQTFWNEFFEVFGVTRRRVAAFERPVPRVGAPPGRIDLLWKGRLLVEHKSRGENLDRAAHQARDYFPGLRDSELPRFVIVSDFARLRLYDLEADDPARYEEFSLTDLPRRIGLFGFLSGWDAPHSFGRLGQADIDAAARLGALHDALEDSGYGGHQLQVLLVRLLFCVFADTTGIFPIGAFREHLDSRTATDGVDLGPHLAKLFEVLNTPDADRSAALDEQLREFPYVNGRLFAEPLPIPDFNTVMRDLLFDAMRVDWARVSPAIFGSLFQSIKDRAARRELGEHYTTETNILKALRPLFLDELHRQFARVRRNPAQLQEFHVKLSRIQILDPACGCGNFLVVAYRELRLLELEVLHARYPDSTAFMRGVVRTILDVNQFHGIEVEEWPAQIAQVAMWLTDHQMNQRVGEEFGQTVLRLPLTASANIVRGNALAIDWTEVVDPAALAYIVGNPPFHGSKMLSVSQREDMRRIWRGVPNAGVLDYVTGWYRRALDMMTLNPAIETALVSTNSITQGEQPGILWSDFAPRGLRINFAHRTFKWTSEARGAAAVHCVILGLGLADRAEKQLFDYETPDAEPVAIRAAGINPYLVDGPVVLLQKRRTPLCDVPAMRIGNEPVDGGNYLFTEVERDALLAVEPGAACYFRPWYGGEELINGPARWCLWLGDAGPSEIRAMPAVRERVERVRALRLASTSAPTRALADTPTRFHVTTLPQSTFLVVPKVSSEMRRLLPMVFLTPPALTSDLLFVLQTADPYHFGVLSSTMHMAWVRAVCGRLESRYRYSVGIVYNNFAWPNPTPAQRAAIAQRAGAVLDARAAHPNATLADLYDPVTMPPNLVAAHAALDRAVDTAYAAPRGGWLREAARVAHLFTLYQSLATPLAPEPRQRPVRAGRRRSPR